MNSLDIKRQNGNVPKTLAGQDHVSGIIFYVNEADIPESFKTAHVQAVSTIDRAKALGITDEATSSWATRLMHYQLDETFRINDGISLYVGIFAKPAAHTFAELATMQNYANGAIRQFGIWDGLTALTAENVTLLQAKVDALDTNNAPAVVGYAPSLKSGYQELDKLKIAGAAPRVSVIIAQAGGTNDTGALLFAETSNKTTKNAVSCIGVWLGHVSAAAVHESISWVKKFPSGISLPALSDGTEVRNIDKAWLEKLDAARFLFLTPIVGVSGSYWNDSHNAAISDYNAIELVRTMDKACRGIRTYLTPELGGNVYIEASTGKLQSYTVAHLETTANKALEDMEKAGELSGYQASVDPEQDVLATSTVEVVIKNVPVGVFRKIKVKIGYVKSL